MPGHLGIRRAFTLPGPVEVIGILHLLEIAYGDPPALHRKSGMTTRLLMENAVGFGRCGAVGSSITILA
jgi:hypothetical protein